MTTTSSSPAGSEAGGSARPGGRISQKQRSPSDGTDSGGGSRETWISTNKILNSSLCGRRMNSRNPNFDHDETRLLISLWGDPMVQKTLITTHKKHPVIAELARKMREQGYNRSTEEINTRIKNLKCFYNRIKKDMAAGIINQTTWRHYAEMDEIISRPVFGNAHRLHLLQQQKQQSQRPDLQYQSGTAAAVGNRRREMKDDNDDEDDDDGDDVLLDQIHQFPVKLEVMSDDDDDAAEIRAEDLLMIDAKFPEESVAGSGGGGGGASVTVGKAAGINLGVGRGVNGRNGATNGRAKRKDEYEDEDDDDEDDEEDDDEGSDFDVENEFNDGLDELLQNAQSKSGSGSGSAAKTSFGRPAAVPTPKASNASGLVIETITSANGTTISANPSAVVPPTVPSAGKISVVPTNLLLKQPTAVSSNMTTPIQIYTKPTVSLAPNTVMASVAISNVATAGKGLPGAAVATSVGVSGSATVPPMKLLLVNTVAKDGTTQQILTPASEVPSMSQLMQGSTSFHQTKIPLALPTKTPIVSIPSRNVTAKPPEPVHAAANSTNNTAPTRKGGQQGAGFKSLLTQLVTIQRENLILNQERLALEKERLEFEKQFGGSFVSMVRNMSSFFSGMLQHQRKELRANDGRQPDSAQVKTTSDGRTDSESRANEVPPEVHVAKDDPSPKTNERSPVAHEVSSSPSPTPSSTQGHSTAPTNKRPSTDGANEKPSNRSPSKDAESTLPVLTPAPSVKQNTGAQPTPSDVPLPKKRRMITRNSTQLSQAPAPRLTPDSTDITEESLKMEVISDNDER